MVTAIVIPRDGGGDPRLQELAGVDDFQEVVDGWLEPIEIEALDVTIYVNEAIQRELAPVNSRATALRWFFSNTPDRGHFMVGDVVVTARVSDGASTDLPDGVIFGLIDCHQFVVIVSRNGDDWYETPARFDTLFEAALWGLVLSMGSDLRVSVRGEYPDDPPSDTDDGGRAW